MKQVAGALSDKQINGNIFSKVANKVKSLFSFNSVVYA